MATPITAAQYHGVQLALMQVLGHPRLFNAFEALQARKGAATADLTAFFKAQGLALADDIAISEPATESAGDIRVCVSFSDGSFHCITIRSPVVF